MNTRSRRLARARRSHRDATFAARAELVRAVREQLQIGVTAHGVETPVQKLMFWIAGQFPHATRADFEFAFARAGKCTVYTVRTPRIEGRPSEGCYESRTYTLTQNGWAVEARRAA